MKKLICELLVGKGFDPKLTKRYFSILTKIEESEIKEPEQTHKHHILPKSLFPEYSCFTENPWNCAVLTPRQHFVVHWILAKAETKTYQMSTAFFYMCGGSDNKFLMSRGIVTSRMYDASLKLYRERRSNFKHTEETKKVISEKTKLAFSMDPSMGLRISESLTGLKRSAEFKKGVSERMKLQNPMFKKNMKDRMMGDLNVSKRPEVREKISIGRKSLETRPWEHGRATDESLNVWSVADTAFENMMAYPEKFNTPSKISKLLGVPNKTPVYNLYQKLKGGWNPYEDDRWMSFVQKRFNLL